MEIGYGWDADRMESYLRSYFISHGMEQSRNALDIAVDMHRSQKRAEGLPYIIHPMTIAMQAIAIGHHDDELIAVMLLHDVCEDCPVTPDELDVNGQVREGVRCMTNILRSGETKADSMGRYMEQIKQNKIACLAKLFDRCHNVSTMAGAFPADKLVSYVAETKKHIYPLVAHVKETYPEYADTVFILEYHITSVINALEHMNP